MSQKSSPSPVEVVNKITVKLEKPRRKKPEGLSGFRLGLVITTLVVIFVWMLFTLPYVLQRTSSIQTDIPDVSFIFSSPKYVSTGDENFIELVIVNHNQSEPLSLTATLTFADPLLLVTSGQNQNLSLKVDNLQPGDRITKQLSFVLQDKPSSNSIEYGFNITKPNEAPYVIGQSKLLISPIPKLRSFWSWVVSSSGLITLAITFLWDKFKKLFDNEQDEKS